MAHYIHDEKNNRIEGMSKEEIYALLAAAIQSGELPSVDEDTAFVTMFKSIVDGKTYKMAFCTQAQYNQLEAQGLLETDAYYIITDDTTYDDLVTYIDTQDNEIKNDLNNYTKAYVDFEEQGETFTSYITNLNGLIEIGIEDNYGNTVFSLSINNNHFYISDAVNVYELVDLIKPADAIAITLTPTGTTGMYDSSFTVTEAGLYAVKYRYWDNFVSDARIKTIMLPIIDLTNTEIFADTILYKEVDNTDTTPSYKYFKLDNGTVSTFCFGDEIGGQIIILHGDIIDARLIKKY